MIPSHEELVLILFRDVYFLVLTAWSIANTMMREERGGGGEGGGTLADTHLVSRRTGGSISND